MQSCKHIEFVGKEYVTDLDKVNLIELGGIKHKADKAYFLGPARKKAYKGYK